MNIEIKDRIRIVFEEILKIPFSYGTVERLGGLTNFNYKVDIKNQSYVVRMPGIGTESLINRHDEHLATLLTNEICIDAQNIFFDAQTGIKVSRYISEAETMNADLVKKAENMKEMAELFHKLHTCDKSIPVTFNVFDKIVEYEDLLKREKDLDLWDDYDEVRGKVFSLENVYKSYSVENVFCHNDPLCENFIKGADRMYLVDWEYAGMNDPMWDLADIFIEGDFDKSEEALFKSFYFKGMATAIQEKRIMMNKVFLDFLWSLWGKQRYACGENLLDYANERYNRAKINLSQLSIDLSVL